MSARIITPADASALADAIELMLSPRSQLAYRSRGFMLLNSACHRLNERFWSDVQKQTYGPVATTHTPSPLGTSATAHQIEGGGR